MPKPRRSPAGGILFHSILQEIRLFDDHGDLKVEKNLITLRVLCLLVFRVAVGAGTKAAGAGGTKHSDDDDGSHRLVRFKGGAYMGVG